MGFLSFITITIILRKNKNIIITITNSNCNSFFSITNCYYVSLKVIKISGKRLPPPPRRVIIERLAPLPIKPQPVVVERWLPYPSVKRKVIFQRSSDASATLAKPKNLIIQWQEPEVQIRKEFKYLGKFEWMLIDIVSVNWYFLS